MPILREISASCGMSVKVRPEDLDESLRLMREEGDSEFSLYHVCGKQVDKLNLSAEK